MFDSVFNSGEVIDSDISAFPNDSLYIHTEENIDTEENISYSRET